MVDGELMEEVMAGEFSSAEPQSVKSKRTVDPYVAAARLYHHKDGELEIDDDNVLVSKGDDAGAYVQCWVWVTDKEAGVGPEVWNPKSVWDDHIDYSVGDWEDEVINGDTRQSYVGWVNSRIEMESEE